MSKELKFRDTVTAVTKDGYVDRDSKLYTYRRYEICKERGQPVLHLPHYGITTAACMIGVPDAARSSTVALTWASWKLAQLGKRYKPTQLLVGHVLY